jgi:sugar phosphate permease
VNPQNAVTGEESRWLRGDIRGRALWVLLGALLCQAGLGFGYVFGPLAGEIIAEFDWTRAIYSTARAPQLWVISFASPLVGVVVYRFGAQRVLVLSSVLLAAAFFGFSQMRSLWQLSLLTVAMGVVVVGLGDISVGQLVTRWITRSRGLALGIVYTGSNLGGFFLVRYAVGVADGESWRTALIQLAAMALFVITPAALWLVKEPSRVSASPKPAGPAVRPAGEPTPRPSQPRSESGSDLALSAALKTRSFWVLFGSLFTFFFYFLAMLDHLVLYLVDAGLSRAEATHYFTSALGLGVVSKIALGVIADRIPHRIAAILDYGLLAVSSLLLLALPHSALIWGFVLSFGFATAARDVVYPLLIIECFGELHLAPIYGALMLALAPAGSLGSIFAGAVHDHLHSYTPAFYTFAAVNVLAVVALFLLRDERPPGPAGPAG